MYNSLCIFLYSIAPDASVECLLNCEVKENALARRNRVAWSQIEYADTYSFLLVHAKSALSYVLRS